MLAEHHRRYIDAHCGLKVAEFDMIAALGNTQGLRMGELAAAMITSPASVTRVAQSLEKRGLVDRRRGDRSDREVVARLTAAGERFFDEHFSEVAGFTCKLLDSSLSRAQQTELIRLLDKVLADTKPPVDPERAGAS